MRSDSGIPILSAAWPSILLASLILLPWLGKAHTIDDVTFLLQAEHVLKDPLHPTAFEMVSDGNRIRLSSQLVSGPVMAYLLVPSALLGGAEWAAHIVQYLLMLAGILSTVSLAFRLGLDSKGARIAGLLLASTPAVMVLATTSMADVPAMAFAVLGMERFFAWRQEGRWHECLTAALFFALAALSRPHLILMLPVALVSCHFPLPAADGMPHVCEPKGCAAPTCGAALQSRPRAQRALLLLLPLFLSVFLILLTTYITADPARVHGDFMQATLSRSRPLNTASNLASFFLHWILVFPLALLWILLGVHWRRLWRNPAPYLAAIVSLSIWLLDKQSHKVPVYVLVLAFAGTFVLLDIFADSWRRRDGMQLFLAVWLLISLPAIAYVQLPSKYLVASAPAAAILLARLAARGSTRRMLPPLIAASAGIVLTLLITAADAQLAALGKRVAREQIAPLVSKGIRVWVNSEWGFEWYAIKAGAVPVAKQPPSPSPGDVLFSSSVIPPLPLERFPNRELASSIRETSRFGRIMNRSAGAGFYSNGWGYLPWSWRNGELEDIKIWNLK